MALFPTVLSPDASVWPSRDGGMLRVVYATHGNPDYIPPLPLSPHQINVGPGYPDATDESGRILSRHVEANFDATALIDSLPADQKPDLFVALVDAWQNCVPRNIAALPCRSVLIIADTHHGQAPLTTMLDYAASEPYHRLTLTHDPHHLHWFHAAGHPMAACHLNLNVHDQELAFQDQRAPKIAFIGQSGPHHPRRGRLLKALMNAGLPVLAATASPPQAAEVFSKAQISFNCSLNGDLNMRILEVLSAGGCLMTDRLSAASGLDTLFREGEHLILYDDQDDLVEKMHWYLSHPDQCLRIARQGHEHYHATQSEEIRRTRFLHFALGSTEDARAQSDQVTTTDSRCRATPLPTKTNLYQRAATYQQLQELQRQQAVCEIVCHPDLNPAIARDCSDLHQVRLVAWKDQESATDQGGPISGRCLLIQTDAVADFLTTTDHIPARFLLIVDATMHDLIPLGMAMGRHRLTDLGSLHQAGGWMFGVPEPT